VACAIGRGEDLPKDVDFTRADHACTGSVEADRSASLKMRRWAAQTLTFFWSLE
jgi:hypothetical protein